EPFAAFDVTRFTLRRTHRRENSAFMADNWGKSVLPLTGRLCKFVTIVKIADRRVPANSVKSCKGGA
ncbi:hypothetical protein, partial [Hoeflea sp.]|uniref:hypothetical protein n=1 Tax=Hoeflea sp. TaxID=1940281 RepID=UPI002AFED843